MAEREANQVGISCFNPSMHPLSSSRFNIPRELTESVTIPVLFQSVENNKEHTAALSRRRRGVLRCPLILLTKSSISEVDNLVQGYGSLVRRPTKFQMGSVLVLQFRMK